MQARRLAVPVVLIAAVGAAMGTSAAGAAKGDTLRATLSGSKEVGAKGQGTGTFSGRFSGGKICFTLKFKGTGSPALFAHIHKGKANANGDVVVVLGTSARRAFRNGNLTTCQPVPAALRAAIRKSPASYYVNVHTKAHPAGTMRGQLHA